MRDKTKKIALVSAIMLVTYSTVGGPIAGIQDLKKKLKDEIFIILGDTNPREYGALMKNVAEQVNKLVNDCLPQHGFPKPDESKQELLKGQVQEALSSSHPVHKLVCSRLLSFILDLISAPRPGDLRIPPGLSAMSEELSELCGQFLRLVSHNRAVFSTQYANIISSLDTLSQD